MSRYPIESRPFAFREKSAGESREALLKERTSTLDLLVLTSLDWLIVMFKILITYVAKQDTSMRRSTVLSLPLRLVFHGERERGNLY